MGTERIAVAISDEFSAYQAYLEGARAHPEDEQLAEDLKKAQAAAERSWLEGIGVTTTSAEGGW